ncbi:hypothetical protein CPB83DRAFT_298045 [Crepidotus variabilis]|uniref:RBR-type E3 ubiquitin transferase n=1 Tax=Crepidotus variabilis TaxID=179855 RepID=A0A9P6JQP2_9AGAR|nr:hypothetical protein CPB83DRAFT_298045 [Crepidotus variabilis]
MSFFSTDLFRATSTTGKGKQAASTPPPDSPFDLDYETAALIAKLAMEDLDELRGQGKGKARANAPLTDEEYALQLQSQQYQELLTSTEDARIANSLREASATDAAYLEALVVAEQAAAEDRRAALALSRGEALPPVQDCQRRLEDPAYQMHPNDQAPSSKQKAVSFSIQDDDSTLAEPDDDPEEEDVPNQYAILRKAMENRAFGTGSSSGSGAGTSSMFSRHVKKVNCTICDDSVTTTSALETSCGHYYCRGCIREHADLMTRDETLYPLRCCKAPIEHNKVFPFLSLALRKQFEAKNVEFSVPPNNRIYCCSPTCSAFLGATTAYEGVKGLRCGKCQTVTCPRCKQSYHPNERACSDNTSALEVRELARTQGWQTCPGCHAIVELNIGCYHMTCRCSTQFCYLCAVPWKGCVCPQWDEGRLLQTAQQRVENEMGGARAVQMQAAAPARFAALVEQRATGLREDHNCMFHNWQYRRGGGECENCNYYLPNFLLICRGCSLLVCKRCSRNRL